MKLEVWFIIIYRKSKKPTMNKILINHLAHKYISKNAKIVAPLSGGMMNLSYIIENDNKRYVLYLSTKQANEMVNRELEKENQRLIYTLGITSKNIFFNTKKGNKINEFIDGVSLDKTDAFDYEKIAKLMQKLHNSPVLSKEDYQPFKRFIAYEKEAQNYQANPSEEYLKLREKLFENKAFLESQKLALCHNDAQKSNIIKAVNDEYYLIDFEFVGNNDPIYDIAAFGNGKVTEGRKLLDYYTNKPNKDEIKRFYLWRISLSLQWHNVAITKHYRGEGIKHGFDFLAVAKFFLDNALEAAKNIEKEVQ